MQFRSLLFQQLIFWICLFIAVIEGVYSQDGIGNLSCELSNDVCGWKIETEIIDENVDAEGWVIFSPHLDGNKYNLSSGSRFLFVHANTEMRTHVISKPYRKPEENEAQLLNFQYFVENGSELVVYVYGKQGNDSGYSFLWSSPKEKFPGHWDTVQIPFLCQTVKDVQVFQLSFVAFLTPGYAVGLFNVSTAKMTEIPESCARVLQQQPGILQFVIIFFIFLLFGSLFLTAILMVSKKYKRTPANNNINVASTFQNPAFAYRKLNQPIRTPPTIQEEDAEL